MENNVTISYFEFIYYIEVRSSKDEFRASLLVDNKVDIKANYTTLWMAYPSDKITIYEFNRKCFYDNLCSGYKISSFKDESSIVNPMDLV